MRLDKTKIRVLLAERNKSFAWLARKLEVSPQKLSYHLIREKYDLLKDISLVFGVSEKELLIFDE